MLIAHLVKFRNCRRGNITVLTALMAVPLLILLAGVTDLHRSTRLMQVMQQSADAAVLATARRIALSHKQREQFANRHFHANLNGATGSEPVTSQLYDHRDGDRIILTFEAYVKNPGVLNSSSLAAQDIRVSARAELRRRPGAVPRLIGRSSGRISRKPRQ